MDIGSIRNANATPLWDHFLQTAKRVWLKLAKRNAGGKKEEETFRLLSDFGQKVSPGSPEFEPPTNRVATKARTAYRIYKLTFSASTGHRPDTRRAWRVAAAVLKATVL